MTVLPLATPVARPAALTVATLGDLELQATKAVRSAVPPSAKRPVAANCCVLPAAMVGFTGVTVIDTNPLELPVPLSATCPGLPAAP
jgi:hypothetical protein